MANVQTWHWVVLAGLLAVFNGSAALAQLALASWAGRGARGLAFALALGWFYVIWASRPLLGLVPTATRPRSALALALGVTQLQATGALIGLAFVRRTREVRGRATHTVGVMARGTAQVVASPRFPSHSFFKPGRAFDLVLRHADGEWPDEATLDIRGVGFRMTARDTGELFDQAMNTGRAQTWHTKSFFQFLRGHLGGKKTMQRWLGSSPKALRNVLAGLVRAPSSFANLTYYGQHTFRFVAADGVERACRYRLRPAVPPSNAETISAADSRTPWDYERLPDERRPENYLSEEYRQRVAAGPVKYMLELQLQTIDESAGDAPFDGSESWDEKRCPWLELASFEVREIISGAAENALRFNIANAPASLGVFRAWRPSDFNSILWYRLAVYERSQRARARLHAESEAS